MSRVRLLNGLMFLSYLAMALFFGWSVAEGDDEVPGAVIVIGGVGGIFVVIENVAHWIRRRKDPDREFR